MRICSLLPSATEVIASLGLSDELVGISHECDYPPSIKNVPVMVEPMIPSHGLASDDIDRQVHQLVASGQRLYRLNDHLLREAHPDLILSAPSPNERASPARASATSDRARPDPRGRSQALQAGRAARTRGTAVRGAGAERMGEGTSAAPGQGGSQCET